MGAVRSNLDFGLVVKPIGITVKKEGGNVVETSVVVRTQVTREYCKRGQELLEPKKTPKMGPQNMFQFQNFEFQNFEFQNFETFKSFEKEKSFMAWCLRRCWFLLHIFAACCM